MKYTESQTIAIERLLPVGVPDGMDARRYAQVASLGLRILKRIPGMK
ncbi:hypothetical protein [Micromonospora chersina]